MDASQWVTLGIAALASIPGILAFFKWRPGQKERTTVAAAEGLLNTAKGTVDLITAELQEQYQRAVDQRNQTEVANDKLHAELVAAHTRLARVNAELAEAEAEVKSLRAQVARLTAEVIALGGQP